MPKFENEARASAMVVAPTVIAVGARAGETLHAFCVLVAGGDGEGHAVGDRALRPRRRARVEAPPPRLMLATAGCRADGCAVTQSMPAITPDVEPEPLQLSTRTAISGTPLATP